MIHILSLILSFTLISAAPVVVYQTVNKGTVYATSYAPGATPGAANVGFTTLYSNAVSWTSTLTPEETSTKDYATVLPSTTAAPAVAASSSIVAAAVHSHSTVVVAVSNVVSSAPVASSAAASSAAPAASSAAPAASSAAPVASSAAPVASSAAPVAVSSAAPVASSAAAASSYVAPAASTTTNEAAGVITITSSVVHTIVSVAPITTSTPTTSASAPTTTSPVSGPRVTSTPKYVVYSPYNSDSTCKDANTVKSDLQSLKNKGVNRIRMYATDCNSLNTVQPAAAALGIRIVQGLWIGTSGVQNAYNQLGELISSANGNWGMYDSIVVGNEDVTNGYISASQLLEAVKHVRATLQSNGFYGDVIAAETTTAYKLYPTEMCDSSYPFLGLNAHSYFAPSFSAQQAGQFVKDQIDIVKGLCSRSDIWISETGYPWKGDTHGNNVPSKQNQADAVNAILEATNLDCVILAQYDDMWKQPGQYGIEQYFGVLDIVN